MTSNTLSLPKALALIAASVVLGVALAEVYAVVGEGWLGAAVVHTVFASVVVVILARRRTLSTLLHPGGWTYYAPTLVILVGAAVLGLMTMQGPASVPSIRWAWILWVPIIEELFFRVGLGTTFRSWAGPLWGAWFSAIVFALAHAAPTIANLTAGKVGLPIGPFLLALACEALLVKTGRILPAIALHAACNATVVIFAATDARWLSWLGFLYQ